MEKSNISQGIPPEVLTLIEDHLKACRDAIAPYVIPMTAEERRTVYKAADGSEAFIEKGISYAQRFPQFVPGQLDVKQWVTFYTVMTGLMPVVQMANDLLTVMCDTKMSAGAGTMQGALCYYNSAHRAAIENVPSAKDIYTDMKKRYERKKKTEGKEIVVMKDDTDAKAS